MIADYDRRLKEAWTARGNGDYDKTRQILESLSKEVSSMEHAVWGRIHHISMQIALDQDQHLEALQHSKQSVALYEMAGNPDRIAHSRRHMGDIQIHLNLMDDARQNYESAIAIYREQNRFHNPDLANALRSYALLLEKLRLPARSVWEEVRSIYAFHDITEGVNEANNHLDEP